MDKFRKRINNKQPEIKQTPAAQQIIQKTLHIHHHTGLGDHIICNGLIRYLHKTSNSPIKLVVKERNLLNIKRMYRDCNWIDFVLENNIPPENWLRIGFERCVAESFDRSFYEIANVPFSERWDSWHLERDRVQEEQVISDLNLPKNFALIHNTSSDGSFKIIMNNKIPTIVMQKTKSEKSIFDWVGVIERATEIHCIDSSFIHLVESIRETTSDLFYHRIRRNPYDFSRKRPWKIIQYG